MTYSSIVSSLLTHLRQQKTTKCSLKQLMLTVLLNNACIKATAITASNKHIKSQKISSSMVCFSRNTF